jgi:dihydroxyacetone kinase DhaKLM complex PTS-EIIA-like component DhaM
MAFELTNNGHPKKPMYVSQQPQCQLKKTRFQCLGRLADLKNAIFNEQMAVELTDDRHPDKPMYLSNLGISQETCFEHLGQLADLENAIFNEQMVVELTDDRSLEGYSVSAAGAVEKMSAGSIEPGVMLASQVSTSIVFGGGKEHNLCLTTIGIWPCLHHAEFEAIMFDLIKNNI